MAERIGQADGMDCSYDGWLAATELAAAGRGGPHLAEVFPPTDWRAAGAALAFLAERVRAAGDRANGQRLKDLAEKVEGAARWCESFLGCLRKLEEPAAKLPQDDAAR
jgi:hypothetical protein